MNNPGENCTVGYFYPEDKARRAYSITGGALLVLFLMVQAAAVVLMVACGKLFPSFVEQSWFVLVLNFVSIYVVGFPFYLLFIKRTPAYSPVKKKMPAGKLVVAALISIGLIYALSYVTMFFVGVLEAILGYTIPSGLDETLTSSSLWMALASTIVVAPIAEEYMFRKLICDRTAVFGEWQAILISGLAFSLFHGSIHQLLYTFALGCFFALVYIRTGKLIYTVILHFAVNFIGSVPSLLLTEFTDINSILMDFEQAEMTPEHMLEHIKTNALPLALYFGYVIVTMFLMVCGLVLLFVNLKKIIKGADERYMPSGKRFSIMFGSAGIWIFAFLCFGTIMLNILSPMLEGILS